MLHLMRALLAAAIVSGAACNVYDPELPYSNYAGDSSVTPGVDACVAETEICNGKDDDCDGETDEATAVAAYCATKILHSPSICQSKLCVKIGVCDDGFCNSDGEPANGCESPCPCTTCDDAGR